MPSSRRPPSSISKANMGAAPILSDPLLRRVQDPTVIKIENQLAYSQSLQERKIQVFHRRKLPGQVTSPPVGFLSFGNDEQVEFAAKMLPGDAFDIPRLRIFTDIDGRPPDLWSRGRVCPRYSQLATNREDLQSRSKFTNRGVPIAPSKASRFNISHKTSWQPPETPSLDSVPSLPSQPGSPVVIPSGDTQTQPQSQPRVHTPNEATLPPVGYLNLEFKEHAGFIVGLSGVFVAVALNAICSEKTQVHPQICHTLAAFRIFSLALNLGALATYAILLLFPPPNGLFSRCLRLFWATLFVLCLIFTFSQIVLFSWPEDVQVVILALGAGVCVIAGIICCLEIYARSRAFERRDLEMGNL